MSRTAFKGQPVELSGEFVQVGDLAPDFHLTKTDLGGL